MSVLSFDEVSLALGGKNIVENLAVRIADQDRIGLIGPNGSGKTTLLRLMALEQQPDGGRVRVQKMARVGYLPQDVSVAGGQTLIELIRRSVPGRAELEKGIEVAEADLAEASALSPDAPDYEERLMEAGGRVGELHERLAAFEQQYSEHRAMSILAGLGFSNEDHHRDMGEFSGGWKMRAVLASLLFQRPELLLLDEPTNHLDMPSVAWLSSFLKKYDRAFVLISHDREFLNEQINRVVSFEPEGVRQYKGNLDSYARQREEERVLLDNRARNVQREREQLERFIKRFKAKATKAAQARSKMKQLEKLEDVQVHQDRAVMSFRFPPSERAGKIVLETENLDKAYGDNIILDGVELRVKRGDRIALLGVNGAGKTTLLRILAGEIGHDEGSYEFGHKTKLSYYAQHHAESLDAERTVLSAVSSCAKDKSNTQIRAVLGAMLFGEREIDKRVGVLSGGERARVALAQMLIDPGNVLLMDEPTNHLDLESSERLADALDTFDGTLLFVSHNRAFIRRLADKIWFVKDGKVEVYPGNFDEYMARFQDGDSDPWEGAGSNEKKNKKSKKKAMAAAPKVEPPKAKTKEARRKEAEQRKARQKVLRPIERRIGDLEKRIEKLEAAQAKRTAEMSDPKVYEDSQKMMEVQKDFSRAQVELEVAMESWSEETEKLDQAKAKLDAELG